MSYDQMWTVQISDVVYVLLLHFIVGPYVLILYNVFLDQTKIFTFIAYLSRHYCSPEVNFYDFHKIYVNLFFFSRRMT